MPKSKLFVRLTIALIAVGLVGLTAWYGLDHWTRRKRLAEEARLRKIRVTAIETMHEVANSQKDSITMLPAVARSYREIGEHEKAIEVLSRLEGASVSSKEVGELELGIDEFVILAETRRDPTLLERGAILIAGLKIGGAPESMISKSFSRVAVGAYRLRDFEVSARFFKELSKVHDLAVARRVELAPALFMSSKSGDSKLYGVLLKEVAAENDMSWRLTFQHTIGERFVETWDRSGETMLLEEARRFVGTVNIPPAEEFRGASMESALAESKFDKNRSALKARFKKGVERAFITMFARLRAQLGTRFLRSGAAPKAEREFAAAFRLAERNGDQREEVVKVIQDEVSKFRPSHPLIESVLARCRQAMSTPDSNQSSPSSSSSSSSMGSSSSNSSINSPGEVRTPSASVKRP